MCTQVFPTAIILLPSERWCGYGLGFVLRAAPTRTSSELGSWSLSIFLSVNPLRGKLLISTLRILPLWVRVVDSDRGEASLWQTAGILEIKYPKNGSWKWKMGGFVACSVANNVSSPTAALQRGSTIWIKLLEWDNKIILLCKVHHSQSTFVWMQITADLSLIQWGKERVFMSLPQSNHWADSY